MIESIFLLIGVFFTIVFIIIAIKGLCENESKLSIDKAKIHKRKRFIYSREEAKHKEKLKSFKELEEL